MKQIIYSALQLSAKVLFSLGKYRLKIWVENFENYVFAIQGIGNREKFYYIAFPTVTKLIPLHTVVVLHFHTSYKNSMNGQGGRLKNNVL